MHVWIHALSAAPFLLLGSPLGALGCVAPDVALVNHEVKHRLLGIPAPIYLSTLPEREILLYRFTHSVVFVALCAMIDVGLAAGVALHVALDLPSHGGRFAQRPLWPLPWVWPNSLRVRRYRDAA